MSSAQIKEIIGTEGNDTLIGTEGNDTIDGNQGDDLKIGGAGNDRFIWNNGDGSDINEGDDGYDVSEINGAPEDGDQFDLRANGERAFFERINLGPFSIDTDNLEQFEINGLGGDDTLTVQDLAGTDVQQVVFTGDAGNDILDASHTSVNILAQGGEGEDTLIGGAGNDVLTGGDGHDVFSFGTGFGADTITDFGTADILNFGTYSDDVNQILGAATQDGHNTLIDFGSDSLTLENFALSDLTADNIFI